MNSIFSRWRPRSPTQAWLLLLLLTLACLSIAVLERGVLPWVGWLVAALVWLKARLVLTYYLEIAEATPVFRRLAWAFIVLTPLALVATAWLEAG
ncbi:MAG: hypothetical protein LCH89_16395 [Proteobacteria bacterium]|jgi:hypothetical protein|nr:hypothetical protein [Pseudomonadota bacterium]